MLKPIKKKVKQEGVECVWCNTSIHSEAVEEHDKLCSVKPVTCEFCANPVKTRLLMDKHLRDECSKNPERIVKCICGESFPVLDIDNHMISNIASHLYLLGNSLKKLSTFSFSWMFKLKARDLCCKTDDFDFGGISWSVRVAKENKSSERFGVFLSAVIKESNLLHQQKVNFAFMLSNDMIQRESKGLIYNNQGMIWDKKRKEWGPYACGLVDVYILEPRVEYKMKCTIEIL